MQCPKNILGKIYKKLTLPPSEKWMGAWFLKVQRGTSIITLWHCTIECCIILLCFSWIGDINFCTMSMCYLQTFFQLDFFFLFFSLLFSFCNYNMKMNDTRAFSFLIALSLSYWSPSLQGHINSTQDGQSQQSEPGV